MDNCPRVSRNEGPHSDPDAVLVARLRLPNDLYATFITFRTKEGNRCFDVLIVRSDGREGVPLECFGDAHCPVPCLGTVGASQPTGVMEVVAGIIDSRHQLVRLELADGSQTTYAVKGPSIEALSGDRVFMTNIGSRGLHKAIPIEPAED
jgi:hypothetical protein